MVRSTIQGKNNSGYGFCSAYSTRRRSSLYGPLSRNGFISLTPRTTTWYRSDVFSGETMLIFWGANWSAQSYTPVEASAPTGLCGAIGNGAILPTREKTAVDHWLSSLDSIYWCLLTDLI